MRADAARGDGPRLGVYKAEPKASEETPRDEAPAVSSETATQDAPASEEAIPETDTADTPALAESF